MPKPAPKREGKERRKKHHRKEGDACQASFLGGCPHNLRHSYLGAGGAVRKVSLCKPLKVKSFSAELYGFFSVGKTRASNHSLLRLFVRCCASALDGGCIKPNPQEAPRFRRGGKPPCP